MTFFSPSTPSISASSCGHDRRLHVGADARTTGAEHRVHLVEEHDDRPALLALLAGTLEHEPDLTLGLADVLVEQLGAFDVDEVRAPLALADLVGDLLGERVGDGLRDQRLAAPGRPVEQDALRRRQAVLGEQLVVQERQLDRVGDRLDLGVEAADVGVRDVGHLLEQQVLDLGAGQLLEQHVRARVEPQEVAAAQARATQHARQLAHPLLVGAPDDDRADAVLHHLLERDHLAGVLRPTRLDHVVALVEGDLGAEIEQFVLDVGVQLHLHLAPAGEHVDRAVVVLADDHAVRVRWLGELVDLVAQRRDVLARLAQRVAQLLVLGGLLGQLALRLEQPLLERAHPVGRVGEAGAQVGVLLTQQRELRLERASVVLPLLVSVSIRFRHRSSPVGEPVDRDHTRPLAVSRINRGCTTVTSCPPS